MNDYQIETIIIPAPDLKQIALEDSLNETLFLPHRFSVLLPVNANLLNSGNWIELPDGRWIWRLMIRTDGALATSLYFDDFNLSEGVKLFLYDESGKQVKGSFTTLNNHKSRLFATELIYGNSVILELNCPSFSDGSSLNISDLAYAYRDVPRYDIEIGFGGSDFCEVNIGCNPEGINWQDEKNGVVRIQVKVSGSGYWCSGSLVNNVRNDHTPYVLTADHCAFQAGHYATAADLNQWIFYFNYESPTCENPPVQPTLKSMTGAAKMAQGGNRGSTGSDFYLLQLNNSIPNEYNPYFIGWSAEMDQSSSGVSIHHPQGDIKKISTYNTTLETVSLPGTGSGLLSHWKVFWTETDNGWGVTEPGSSGSPIFNEQGKIIGTLTGGFAACESSGNYGPDKPDYYGKFSYHWFSNGNSDTAQLKPWLDPDNTGITQLDGKFLSIDEKNQLSLNSITIYPNPSSNFISINFINFEPSIFNIKVFDVLGNPINNVSINTNSESITMDVRGFPEGVYLIWCSFDQRWIVKKFVKHKNDNTH